jgi:hypothetical protein
MDEDAPTCLIIIAIDVRARHRLRTPGFSAPFFSQLDARYFIRTEREATPKIASRLTRLTRVINSLHWRNRERGADIV